MSNFLELVKSRYSVRLYDPDRDVSDEDILSMLETASLAPSASNRQPWRYIIVKDKELREQICKRGLGGVISNNFACSAPVIVVLAVDMSFNYVKLGEYTKGIPYAFIDVGISGEHFVLRAAELGIGTCWIGWFREREIKKILAIPRNVKIASLISVGYPKKDSKSQKTRKPVASFAFKDRYGNNFGFGHKE